jgi:hypothetical protein
MLKFRFKTLVEGIILSAGFIAGIAIYNLCF